MVLPVGDTNPTRNFPAVTLALIAANVAVFVAFNLQLEGCAYARFVYRWAAIPKELLTFDPLPTDFRAVRCELGPALQGKNVMLSAVSSTFLHAGWAHLGFNMLFLWIFGNNVEDRLGHLRYVMYYLVGGVASAYGFALLHSQGVVPLLGASGAIAAVLGGYLLMFPRARVHTYVPFPLYLLALLRPSSVRGWYFFFAIVSLPAWLVLGFWFITQLMSLGQLQTDVAFEAHIAGFITGMLLTLALGAQRAPDVITVHRAWR